jgi:cellulose biosynthesis protein BcsQ
MPSMSAAVVAVLNRKGGAGKTSLTKDLGFALADAGARVLQVGLDPQSSLEVLAGLGFDTPPDRTVSRLLMPEEFGDVGELVDVVHETPWRTQLIPASKALATAERALGEPGRGGINQRLRRGLERLDVDERYDIVLIDCPPGMTPLTMNALVAARSVLVPTQLDFLSVAGLAVLMETVEEVREYARSITTTRFPLPWVACRVGLVAMTVRLQTECSATAGCVETADRRRVGSVGGGPTGRSRSSPSRFPGGADERTHRSVPARH